MVSLTFHFLRIFIFNIMFIKYAEIVIFLFILYYFLFEIQTINELFVNKTALSFTALILLLLTISQIQSIYIDFPITTIRPGAVINYPFVKSIIRLMQLLFFLIFSLCVAHYSVKRSFEKVVSMHTNVVTGISLFFIAIFFSSFVFPHSTLVNITSVHMADSFIRMRGFFEDPTTLAFYLLTSIPLSIALFAITRVKKELVKFSIQVFCLFLTFSRAGWLSLGAVVFLCILFFWKEVTVFYKRMSYRKQISLLLVVGLFCFIVLSFSYEPLREFVNKRSIELFTDAIDPNSGRFWSTRLRLEAYSTAISAFQMHPVMGVGIFNFHFYGGFKKYAGLYDTIYVNYPEPNNILLTVLSELGLLGVLVLVCCLLYSCGYFIRIILKGKDEKARIFAKGFLISLLSVFVMMQFTSKFMHPFFFFFFGLILCFAEEYNLSFSENIASKHL